MTMIARVGKTDVQDCGGELVFVAIGEPTFNRDDVRCLARVLAMWLAQQAEPENPPASVALPIPTAAAWTRQPRRAARVPGLYSGTSNEPGGTT